MFIRNFLHKIGYFTLTLNIQTLIAIPILLGFISFGLLFFTGPGYTGTPAQKILISLGFLWWALSGVPKIIRHESAYGPVHLNGALALFDGVVTVVSSLVLASLPLIFWNRL